MNIDNKSYINKDFQTIYPELVEFFTKLTSRLDLRATNESDPIVVLIKELAFIADKQNFNIDQNVLQTFLQSATQLEAFRSQAEINGYTMKYYESASTKVTMMYSGDESNLPIQFYPFETKFTDANNEVIYTMVGDDRTLGSTVSIGSIGTSAVCYAYEGEDVDFSINGVTTIQLANLDDENKLFFPEQMIASNIIFVKNADEEAWTEWRQVDNLNITVPLSKVFKFGYDSNKNLPYIEFPNDIEELVGSGINVKYFRTKGVGGNIIAKKLTQLKNSIEGIESSYLYVSNTQSALNGKDPESIDEAYKNYKRTIGTFDTLTTTQDFANYLYRALSKLTSQPLVSNIQVTDRRTDTNLATAIISYDEFGANTVYKYDTFGTDNGTITPFDLVLYPLTYIANITSDNEYDMTFTPTGVSSTTTLLDALDGAQSIDHTYLNVSSTDLISKNYPYLYKNMYALNCRISTTHKVNGTEQLEILANVRQALYDNFNAREVEYGKEIDFDDLLDVIEESDTRIKNVSLDEPEVTTKVCLANGTVVDGNAQYIDRVFKNVAAGRMELYNYNTDFKFELGKTSSGGVISNVTSVEPRLDLSLDDTTPVTLKQNQVVQLYAQSYGIDFNALYGVLYYFDGGTNNTSIARNEVHRLENDEILFINTTQDDVTYTMKYTPTTKTKYDANGNVISTEIVEEVIIQPNFQLDTTTGGRHDIIVDGQTYSCKMLGTSDKISFMKKTTKRLTSPMLAYWFVNNVNNELFTDNNAIHTHMLDEGEYLFLTDATKTQLTIFGSGTKLSAPSGLLTNWKLDRNNLVTLETFSSEDISTYGAISWVTLPMSSTNYFDINPQQVITLTEGDKIKLVTGSLDLDDSNSHMHTFAQDEGIVYNETNTIKSTNTLEWSIRTRLDLGISYDVGQQLTTDPNNIYVEKVIVNEDDTTPITNCWLQAYDPIQTSTYTITDNTKLFSYQVSNVTYTKGASTETITPDINGAYTIKLETWTSGDKITVPLTQVTGNTSAFMLYLNNITGNVSLSCSDIDTNLNTGDTQIRDGMNNLVIKNTSSTATINISSDAATLSATVTILPLRVYDGYNPIFHLDDITGGEAMLETKLATIEDKFYFLYDVPNSKAIDVNDYRDANALWEVNDILNSKTLPQIDFDNSIIKIIKSSRQ